MSSATENLNDHESNTVTRHSDNFTALKITVMTKANFITNFTYKVYNKHPDGRTLVYFYRLSYWPTARADHPPGLAARTKGSGPPAPGWSRPQASTAHLPQ